MEQPATNWNINRDIYNPRKKQAFNIYYTKVLKDIVRKRKT